MSNIIFICLWPLGFSHFTHYSLLVTVFSIAKNFLYLYRKEKKVILQPTI